MIIGSVTKSATHAEKKLTTHDTDKCHRVAIRKSRVLFPHFVLTIRREGILYKVIVTLGVFMKSTYLYLIVFAICFESIATNSFAQIAEYRLFVAVNGRHRERRKADGHIFRTVRLGCAVAHPFSR